MGRDPFPLMILHFQASDLVLPQQGQAAVVGVGGDPELASAEFPGLGGIVDDGTAGDGFLHLAHKGLWIDPHAHGKSAHHLFPAFDAFGEEGIDRVPELRKFPGPLVSSQKRIF